MACTTMAGWMMHGPPLNHYANFVNLLRREPTLQELDDYDLRTLFYFQKFYALTYTPEGGTTNPEDFAGLIAKCSMDEDILTPFHQIFRLGLVRVVHEIRKRILIPNEAYLQLRDPWDNNILQMAVLADGQELVKYIFTTWPEHLETFLVHKNSEGQTAYDLGSTPDHDWFLQVYYGYPFQNKINYDMP